MNTLQLLTRTARPCARRFLASAPPRPGVPKMYDYNYKKEWFGDPSTYPLMVILSFVGFLAVGTFAHELSSDKDLRLSSDVKTTVLRNYGDYKTVPAVKSVANPNFLPPEGLGVDHDEWLKAKMGSQEAQK